jgi:catechol 2,3-dioxygenase-like lactoylglutathione lyase family enzyme
VSQHEKPAKAATDPPISPPVLPATLRLGAVHLTVSDLDRSIAFYEDAIGLQTHRRETSAAAMGVGKKDLLVPHEEQRARRAGRHAGLYHYALLFPSREELARGAAPGVEADPHTGRLRSRYPQGHLPPRPRRQRHRARRR